jgi:hypothetical protein
MGKQKAKVDFKQLLLAKGEYAAMGLSAFFLLVLLLWGITKWSSAKDPSQITKDLQAKAKAVHNKITNGEINAEDEKVIQPPEWVAKPLNFKVATEADFKITGPQFDPIAKPDTKKENPRVLPIGFYQVNLTRVPMNGFDIIVDRAGENPMIAVISDKQISKLDKDAVKKLGDSLRKKGRRLGDLQRTNQNNGPAGFGPGGPGGPPGFGPGGPGGPPGFGPGGPGGPPGFGPGGPGGPPGRPRPFGPGGMGQGYESNAQRIEKSVEYVPLADLDKAMEKGKAPAMTVIPLRMVTIHAEVPYKKQVEEIKRALRLATNDEAMAVGPIYEGYEVQRKVSKVLPDGQILNEQDWADYKFEEKYKELVNARKLADNIEDGYLSYFIRYDMMLALPLPQLVTELGDYPPITLENITKTIRKLQEADKPKVDPSDVLKRASGNASLADLYTPQSGDQTAAATAFGQAYAGPGAMKPMPGANANPRPPMGMGNSGMPDATSPPPPEVEHLLLRFVDVDVKPGYTYEYRVRLKMKNPNFGKKNEVANPAYASVERLFSDWAQLTDTVTVPPEKYTFAADVSNYRKNIEEAYGKEKELLHRLQVKDYQAVVEICTWMEQVKTDTGGKREPVGAWVVADIPVSRGEYVGRKQYVRLPLWSSESKAYVLREVPDEIVKGIAGKRVAQPKGWLVDFSTRDVLVDFDGGKVTTKVGNKTVTEDVGTEMLIVRADGKLVVKNSLVDEGDPERKQITSVWDKWIKTVETRKANEKNGEEPNGFSPKAPGMN